MGVNKHVKNALFHLFKVSPMYKKAKNAIGHDLDTLSMIMSNDKCFLRSKFGSITEDTPISKEEIIPFLKHVNVKEETFRNSKTIFVILDFRKKTAFIEQMSLTGEIFSQTL